VTVGWLDAAQDRLPAIFRRILGLAVLISHRDLAKEAELLAQSTISRYITFLTPFVEKATEEDRPAAEDAAEATRNAIALVDGTLWPCWSWDGESKLWSGKYKTTGHGSLIVTTLQGRMTFVSQPVTGNQHDMAKLKGSDAEKILQKSS